MPIILKLVKCISTSTSFFYYLTDNIVWFSGMGFVGKHMPFFKMKWKQAKNIFSIIKTVMEIGISALSWYLKRQEELKLKLKLRDMDQDIVAGDSEQYVLIRKMIILRREMRFE